jgi:hypothetical protein
VPAIDVPPNFITIRAISFRPLQIGFDRNFSKFSAALGC